MARLHGGVLIEQRGFTFTIVTTAILYGCATLFYCSFFRGEYFGAIGRNQAPVATAS